MCQLVNRCFTLKVDLLNTSHQSSLCPDNNCKRERERSTKTQKSLRFLFWTLFGMTTIRPGHNQRILPYEKIAPELCRYCRHCYNCQRRALKGCLNWARIINTKMTPTNNIWIRGRFYIRSSIFSTAATQDELKKGESILKKVALINHLYFRLFDANYYYWCFSFFAIQWYLKHVSQTKNQNPSFKLDLDNRNKNMICNNLSWNSLNATPYSSTTYTSGQSYKDFTFEKYFSSVVLTINSPRVRLNYDHKVFIRLATAHQIRYPHGALQ